MSETEPTTSKNVDKVIEFGGFSLDTRQALLTKNGKPIRISPKALEILTYLAMRPNEVVKKDDLIRSVWPDSFVEEANLAVHISALRKILASGDGEGVSIETFPKRGYRLVWPGSRDTNYSIKQKEEAETPLQQPEPRRFRIARLGAAAVLIIGVSIVGGFFLVNGDGSERIVDLQVARVPGTEKVPFFEISPNGEYIAQNIVADGKRNLQLMHLPTKSNIQLVEPDDAVYLTITFTPDGGQVYFVKSVKDKPNTLYRVRLLGGSVEEVMEKVDSRISFSPDGSRFAFVRRLPDGDTALITANADGSGERELAMQGHPDHFTRTALAWSPDGKRITVGLFLRKELQTQRLVNVDVNTGAIEPFMSEENWAGWESFRWLPDGSGLVAAIRKEEYVHNQLFILPYPLGKPIRLFPGDIGGHRTVSLTNDGRTILAEGYSHNTEIWHAGADGTDVPKAITSERHHFFRQIRWVPDGRIVFGSSAGGNRDIWLTDQGGKDFGQVTANAMQNQMPFAARDNEHVIFVSNRAGKGVFNVWRSKLDGSEAVQLTFGTGEQFPVMSPDMKWVVYEDNPMSTQPEKSSIWKVPFNGGDPIQVAEAPTQQADVSPDSRLIACEYKPPPNSKWKIGIFSIEGGPPLQIFDLPEVSPLRWMPDGSAITYIKTENGVANLWAQPIDGSHPYQVTRFEADGIPSYCDWSENFGLICSRGRVVRDAVLITGFR